MYIGKVGVNRFMGIFYILQSDKTGRYYVGCTRNLVQRLFDHNQGKTKSILGHIPLKVVFFKKFGTFIEARRMELKIKSFKSRKIIENIIRDQEIKMGR